MSLAARETSRADGHPINLYDIRYGPEAGSIYRYTNLATEFVFGGNTYLPLAIGHSEIVSSGNLDKSSLELTVPASSDPAKLFTPNPPSRVVSLIIRQGHVDDLDFKVCWAGKILGGSVQTAKIVLDCEPISSSLRRNGLTRDYQYACPLVLFGNQCRASKAAATSAVLVSAVDGPLVTLPSDWAAADRKEKYVGGMAEWTRDDGRAEVRSIIQVNGDVLTLGSAATGLTAGATLSVVLGCDHLQTGCNLHNNILNFGGQPAIPTKNPIGITNNFY